MLCYRCGSHVPDTAERCATCGQRQVGTARMPSATGLRKKLNPALLVGAPYREGEVMAGRYLVKDAVGVGPLGFVLRTADRDLGIDVSVKLIHPRFVQTGEEREAFTKALEPARRFLHPSLTRLHDVGNDQGWPYFTYTFLDGLPLRRIIDLRLAKGQTFALDEVEPILGQLMAALEAAHPTGAHGNLKAENILVLPDMLKVTDWGVAAGMPRPPFVQAQRQKASHRHFAPEYLAGLALEPRADVYSLGVLVGEMLTGLTPEDEIPELRLTNPELPDAIEGFYRRALSERPESRFRSVREMFEAFAAVVEGKPLAAASAPEAVSEAPSEDGFEVVDFVETPMVVVQPEPAATATAAQDVPVPEAAVVESAPEAPEAVVEQAALDAEAAPSASAEVMSALLAADAEAPAEEPATAAAPEAEPASEETPFWAEAEQTQPPLASAPEPAASGTLWSDEEDEAEPEPYPASAEPVAGAQAALPEPPSEVEARPVPAEAVPEPPPSIRPVPVTLPRFSAPAVSASRPAVPAVGLWGPGARRTGTHAAVAVARPEAAVESPSAVPIGRGALFAEPELPVPIRSVPPIAAVARAVESFVPPAVAAVPSAEAHRPPTASAASAHDGGLWSPGAALAELVSEMRAEDAGRASGVAPDVGSVAKAVQVVSEQRASRERLALMSASDAPTVPVPSVTGRPRKTRPVPVVVPPPDGLGRDRILRYAFFLAVALAVGMLGAVLLLHKH